MPDPIMIPPMMLIPPKVPISFRKPLFCVVIVMTSLDGEYFFDRSENCDICIRSNDRAKQRSLFRVNNSPFSAAVHAAKKYSDRS